jgi:uncharacterized protein (TIGR00299 family) protein
MPNDLYLDCQSGISGNMLLGALIDLGLPVDQLESELRRLPVEDPWELVAETVHRSGLAGTHLTFHVEGASADTHQSSHGRHLADIEAIIKKAGFAEPVSTRAMETFRHLAEAEAAVHGTTIDKIHFHEVGAVDAILDIVGVSIGLHLMDIQNVSASTICDGKGTVHCAHGEMPIPVPAVIKLLTGVPLKQIEVESELVTPTGAALLVTLAREFGPLKDFVIEKSGHGCGTRDLGQHPNILRAYLGRRTAETSTAYPRESVVALTSNLDQSTGENLGYLLPLLMEAGALDACLIPMLMKKGRPAQQLQVLCRPETEASLARLIFHHSGTLGIRRQRLERYVLERNLYEVTTPWGPVRVKQGILEEEPMPPQPEHEDCRLLAEKNQIPLREVYLAACRAATKS